MCIIFVYILLGIQNSNIHYNELYQESKRRYLLLFNNKNIF